MNLFTNFAAESISISLPPAPIFTIGPLVVTNSMLLGGLGILIMLGVFAYAVSMVKKKRYNRFVGIVQWAFEGMYRSVYKIIPNQHLARSIAPLALSVFFIVLFTYWIGVIPGVGESITWQQEPLLRGLPTDLNFTLALAIVSTVAVQMYAIKAHGFFGNIGRYFINPFKNPIGTFEGFLELIGEFSRLIALSLRLFGNAFAGEVLLMIAAVLTGYFATISLPLFMAFELFIGFIQAYVFYVLTLIFAALATSGHGDTHTSSIHSTDVTLKEAA